MPDERQAAFSQNEGAMVSCVYEQNELDTETNKNVHDDAERELVHDGRGGFYTQPVQVRARQYDDGSCHDGGSSHGDHHFD